MTAVRSRCRPVRELNFKHVRFPCVRRCKDFYRRALGSNYAIARTQFTHPGPAGGSKNWSVHGLRTRLPRDSPDDLGAILEVHTKRSMREARAPAVGGKDVPCQSTPSDAFLDRVGQREEKDQLRGG